MSDTAGSPPTRDGGTGDDRRANGRPELREAILEEARRLLVDQGFQALSTRRIAAAVGCTATSIYLYYRNKDALLHALIDEGMALLNERLDAARACSSDPVAGVENVARAYLEFGFEHTCYYEVMFMLPPQHMERYPTESYRRARQSLETVARTMAEATGGEPDLVAATTAWTALHGHVSLWIAGRVDKSIPRDAFVDGAVALVRRMLA